MEDFKKSMKSKILKLLGVVATVAILASMLVAPIAAVAPTVTLATSSTTVSAAGVTYTLTFTLGAAILPGTIVLTFPTGANIAGITAAADADVTVACNSGLGTAAYAATNAASVTAGQVLTITPPGNIGAGALVQVVITGVGNPAAIGTYSVSVATSSETTAVASNTFTTTAPVPAALPGVIKVYNTAGLLMGQSNSFTTAGTGALAILGANTGWTMTLTAGTYAETFALANASTILKADTGVAVADVIIKPAAGGVAITGATVTVDGITIDESVAAFTVGATGTTFTIKNCVFKGGAGVLLAVAAGATPGTVEGCTFTATGTVTSGITAGAAITVKTSTFTIDTGATAITTASNITVTGITVTGDSSALAVGLNIGGGVASITGSTLKNLGTALTTAGSTVSFSGNTVDACGIVTTGPNTIEVTAAVTAVNVFNNVITNSKWYVANVVAAAAPNVFVTFNDLTGSAKGINNVAAAAPNIVAANNWWGVATGPAAAANSAGVDATPYLTGKASDSVVALAAATVANATNGVSASIYATGTTTASAAAQFAVGAYAASPVAVAVPATVTAVQYFDVMANGPTTATDDVVIRVNGTTAAPITAASVVLVYNAAFGRWDTCTVEALNTFANYIDVRVESAILTGTPFVLAAAKPVAPNLAIASGAVPVLGATGVAVDTTFAWAAVAGATSYDIVIAEDSTLADKFAVINYSATSPIAMHKIPADQILKYNQIYWWRVRSVNAAGASAWTISSFTTEKEPAAPTVAPTTTVVTTTVPVVTSVPAPIITVQIPTTEPVEVIPPYLLWAVVAVGIILVIAVVVLIVRTRRIS